MSAPVLFARLRLIADAHASLVGLSHHTLRISLRLGRGSYICKSCHAFEYLFIPTLRSLTLFLVQTRIINRSLTQDGPNSSIWHLFRTAAHSR